MSKIVPKTMQSQSSQNVKSNQSRNENTESEVMFAVLFGGAAGETSSEKSLINNAPLTTMILADTVDEKSFDKQISDDLKINDDLKALIASLQGSRGLGQKDTGLQNHALNDELELEQGPTLPESDNSDALALATCGALSPETKGGKTAMPKSALAGLANMVFEDGGRPNVSKGSAAAYVFSKDPARIDGNSLLGQNKALTKIVGPQQAQQNSAKSGENLDINMGNPQTKTMTSDLVKLQALRAANLEQQTADIDEEAAKADLGELKGKLEKNGLTVAGQKQMVVSNADPSPNVILQLLREVGRTPNDVSRMSGASSTATENASAITGTGANASSTGQPGAHTGHQGSTQSGSPSGGGLLGNLNNLQILDTAKDNWTEMLLQRVKNGLSGGKDQLDFQLNPRNLGKMRISLVMQNDRTNIQIQTETSAAASMLSDSEARLAQMLEASGLRLGNLNSGQFQGFGGAGSDQQANQHNQNKTGALNQPDDHQGEVVDELVTEGSDNLINIQA